MYQFHDTGSVPSGGAAALRLDTLLVRPAPTPSRSNSLRHRVRSLQLVTDLGRNIGSTEWFRGAAICAGLCGAAIALAPPIRPIVAASPARLSDVQWEEARTLSIAPLAYGGDTGRRLAATDAVEMLTDTPERPSVDLIAALAPNDGFGRALHRAGASAADAEQAAALVATVMPLSQVGAGTAANITLGRRPDKSTNRPLDLLVFRARFDLKVEVKRINGALTLSEIPIPVDSTPLRFKGRVGSSLYRAARASGASARTVEAYIRALATHTDVGLIRPTDRFDIIVAHRRAATGETETGELLYAGLERGSSSRLQLMQWKQSGKTQWFEASGVGRASGMFQRPVPGNVSSNFGMRRHPILGYSRMHKGMDFRAGYGTPILAASEGRVARAGWAGGYGRQVRIEHGGAYATSYSHMSRLVVAPGQHVRQGQVIGYVGSTGLSTGPHLHYELYYNGRQINPASARFVRQAQLAGAELASFRAKLRGLLGVKASIGEMAEADTPRPTRS